ncbi:unnamed protein product, partial [Vitis vinifera]
MGSPSYNQKGSKGASEAQSQERGLRKSNKRESLASSSEYSTGSPSYGSFTSYEKIHIKHGCGDEEVVTPVRRSSRIRNQTPSLFNSMLLINIFCCYYLHIISNCSVLISVLNFYFLCHIIHLLIKPTGSCLQHFNPC